MMMMKPNNPMHPQSKASFLVKEKGFFSTKQCLLMVTADQGIVRQLFAEPKTVFETIPWAQLQRVSPNEDSSTEFTLEYATLDLYQSIENRTLVLHCKERSLLLCQLQYWIDVYQGGQAQITHACNYFYDGAPPSLETFSSLLSLFITAIHIRHQVPSRARVTQKRQQAIIDRSSQNTVEVREFQQANGYPTLENQLTLTDNTPIESINSPILVTEEDLPPKNTSTFEQERQEELTSTSRVIYLCELSQVILDQKRILLVTKRQEKEWIKLDSREDAKQLYCSLYFNANKVSAELDIQFTHSNEERQDDLLSVLEQDLEDGRVVFNMRVDTFEPHFNEILEAQSIKIDENKLYEVNANTEIQVRKSARLSDLQVVQLFNKSPDFNLVLQFKGSVQFFIRTSSFQERERLISCLVTLRYLRIQSIDQEQTPVIMAQNQPIDTQAKIHGYQVDSTSFTNQMYETEILQTLCREADDTAKVDKLFDTILTNCKFSGLDEFWSDAAVPIDILCTFVDNYLKLEREEFRTIENVLVNNIGCRAQKSELLGHFGGLGFLTSNRSSQVNLEEKKQTEFDEDMQMTHQEKVALMQLQSEEPASEMEFEISDQKEESSRASALRCTDQVLRALNVLQLLLKSPIFFTQVSKHLALMQSLINLLMSKNSLVALVSAQTIRSICQYQGTTTMNSAEKENKRVFLLTYKQQAIDSSAQISISKPGLLSAILKYFGEFEQSLETNQTVYSVHLSGMHLILSSVLLEREQTTPIEALITFYEELNQREDSQHRPIPLLLLIEKFALCRANLIQSDRQDFSKRETFFDIQYLFSMLLCQNLKFLSTQTGRISRENRDGAFQYLLENTIQFILHLYHQSQTQLSKQKMLSIQILSYMLTESKECQYLLKRILPKSLMSKKEQRARQSPEIWTRFFVFEFVKTMDNAQEQWQDNMRRELTQKLVQEMRFFLGAKQDVQQEYIRKSVLSSSQKPTPRNSTGSFNLASGDELGLTGLVGTTKPVKWNYSEFGVHYECLDDYYLVGSYYLTKLLKTEAQTPDFSLAIANPDEFWDELTDSFMASEDRQEQIKILMTLCLLYSKHFGQIGKIKSLGYWLRLIEKPEYMHCQFLLLQLVHIALSVNSENHIKKNMRKFIKEKGFGILHNCINLVFKDLPDLESDPTLFFQEVKDQMQDQMAIVRKENFTANKSHRMYFSRNSMNACLAILSLKIFDLVFTNMQFIDNSPMSSNRQYMLRRQTLATLTWTIMLENSDLTREVLIFIEKHLSDHYTFYQMSKTGMIEFLILCLSTKNNLRALRLLNIFQQVCQQFNQQLKLGGQLAANDLKMILEDKQKREKEELKKNDSKDKTSAKTATEKKLVSKQQKRVVTDEAADKPKPPLLGDSIFLRYLPVPFIKYLYENDEKKFLEIYRRFNYRHPKLIWGASMRHTLEKEIKEGAEKFMIALRQFANDPKQLRNPEAIPIFDRSLQEIVKYDQIKDEVRCGRYYLGVWTSTKTDFKIGVAMEPEFHQKMQAELRYCIYENNLSDKNKIITLFKMCLLALKKFDSSRINSLNEIKRILMAICKPKSYENLETGGPPTDKMSKGISADIESSLTYKNESDTEKAAPKFPYDEQTKILLYIGTKIFHEAIIKDDVNNKTEILTMNGVEIMSDITSFILANTFKTPKICVKNNQDEHQEVDKHQLSLIQENIEDSVIEEGEHGNRMSTNLNKPQEHSSPFVEYESNQEINIKAIEAETLLLSMQATHKLLEEDTQSFIDIRLDQRIEIFTQMTQILNLSFKLYDLVPDRELRKHQARALHRHNTSESFIKTRGAHEDPHNQSSTHQNATYEAGTGNKRRKKPKRLADQADGKPDKQKDKGTGEGDENEVEDAAMLQEFEGVPRQSAQTYKQVPLIRILQQCQDKRTEVKSRESKEQEKYVVDLILKIAKSIFEMMKHICYQPQLHPELIASGLAWQAIRHSYFDLKRYFNLENGLVTKYRKEPKDQYKKLKKILDSSTQSLILLVSFADTFKDQNEKMQFKNLTKPQEQDIMLKFYSCIQRIFTKRMQEELICEFTVNNENKLVPRSEISGENFLKLFSIADYSAPELIWNTRTRSELLDGLQRQVYSLIAEDMTLKESLASNLQNKIHSKSEDFSGMKSRNLSSDITDPDHSLLHDRKGKHIGQDKFCNVMLSFEYSVNRENLRCDKIFVENFNKMQKEHFSFTVEKKVSFSQKIIKRLTKLQQEQLTFGAEQSRESHTQKLVFAFSRLMTEFNLDIQDEATFRTQFDTLCGLINFERDDNSSSQQEIAKCVLDIMKHIAKQRLESLVDFNLAYDVQKNKHYEFLLERQNKSLFKLLIDVLEQRGDSPGCILLKQKVIGFLSDVIKLRDYVVPLFVQQGLVVYLLQILFDKTIVIDNKILTKNQNLEVARLMLPQMIPNFKMMESSSHDQLYEQHYSRQTLLDIILKVELTGREQEAFLEGNQLNYESAGVLKAFIPQELLLEILDKMRDDIENQETIDYMQKTWLHAFDQRSYESVFVHWNDELRQRCWKRVRVQCEDIRQSASSDINRLAILSPIFDGELASEERIKNIMLRVYNKNPNVYIKMPLNTFIKDIVEELDNVQEDLYALKNSEEVDQLSRPITPDMDPDEIPLNHKKFHHVCHRAMLLLSALLLSIEQLLNDFNLNVKNFRSDENLQAQAFMAFKKIDQKVLMAMKVWLQNPVFLDQHIPAEIRITFLQVLYLVVSAKGSLEQLKGETLQNFISDMVNHIASHGEEESKVDLNASAVSSSSSRSKHGQTMLEDSLVLMTVQKLLYIDGKTGHTKSIYESLSNELAIQHLMKIALKNHCVNDVEYIYAKIREAGDKKRIDKIVTKYGTLQVMEHKNCKNREAQMENGSKWRERPTMVGDAKDLYVYREDRNMETFIREKKSLTEPKAHLPIISKQAVAKYDERLLPPKDTSQDNSDLHSRSRSQIYEGEVIQSEQDPI